MSEINKIEVLRVITAHREYVALGLEKMVAELRTRALAHDLSKLRADEFEGFERINQIAREHKYDSLEYVESMKEEKDVIDLHYSRNSHHPEYHDGQGMGFMDIIEMVIDWWSAWQTYGKTQTWEETMRIQRSRFIQLSNTEWWLIDQVSEWIEGEQND